ncbi:MAG: ribonuclease D [Rickettsiaceae bacterium H1]|nr:ribonuclease D [Rickettsiaceae bacterium H1]
MLYEEDLPSEFLEKEISSLAVDTEFMGLSFNRDRLCLVQISTGDGKGYVVRFKKGSDFSAPNLKSLLSNPNITKIFHFARADITMIKHYLGIWCMPCYCTKISSRLVRTYTDHHSLKDLCNDLLDVRLNKQHQSSDWGAYTLSEEQIDYAASDVLYLHKIKLKLDDMLKREGREELAESCFKFLKDRVELDLAGWQDVDIFSHNTSP